MESISTINGYNLTYFSGTRRLSTETREKISKNHSRYWIGKKFTQKHRHHMSENSTRYFLGKSFSDKHINNLRKAKRNNFKPVAQFDLNDVFIKKYESISEASRKTKINKRHISVICNGRRKSIYGFRWKFLNGGDYATT